MKADPKADAAAAPAGGGKSKLIIILLAAVIVLGLGGGAAWYFMHGSAAEETAEAPKKEKSSKKKKKEEHPAEYLAVEPFTVNLQPENGDQYLQVAFTLQVDGPEQAELIKTNMAKVRSRVLLLLSGKKASEISTVEGKQQLAGEILAVVKEPFDSHGDEQEISDVLFTSFIIQ
ncbi:flagellar basal body-associated protein FliL [Herbaspirillum sp. SJZ107]|uniref:flagellar basal body-associated protein FliL n=1 Tax=Herbaspirillum sp. SJZ107 TaxID=2572881 RepID=UPI00116C8408|nr:flagellar basal body-associated protein FliL [Herbaspirillum sp. SJZ107]TQK07520.1 flagellar FliL protein [Herbaspirillum sp. SJZ107]